VLNPIIDLLTGAKETRVLNSLSLDSVKEGVIINQDYIDISLVVTGSSGLLGYNGTSEVNGLNEQHGFNTTEVHNNYNIEFTKYMQRKNGLAGSQDDAGGNGKAAIFVNSLEISGKISYLFTGGNGGSDDYDGGLFNSLFNDQKPGDGGAAGLHGVSFGAGGQGSSALKLRVTSVFDNVVNGSNGVSGIHGIDGNPGTAGIKGNNGIL
jgi:hypothetical protein